MYSRLQVHLLSVEKRAAEGTPIKSTSCTCASNLHIDTLKHCISCSVRSVGPSVTVMASEGAQKSAAMGRYR